MGTKSSSMGLCKLHLLRYTVYQSLTRTTFTAFEKVVDMRRLVDYANHDRSTYPKCSV